MLSTLPMRSSMRSTASLAPPCSGPYSAPTAPAQQIRGYTFTMRSTTSLALPYSCAYGTPTAFV